VKQASIASQYTAEMKPSHAPVGVSRKFCHWGIAWRQLMREPSKPFAEAVGVV
jgi:hypothetical protein